MGHDFVYISKNSPEVKATYQEVLRLIRDWHVALKEFTFCHEIVGSYKRNMITYDRKSNVGYDFDFNIEVNTDIKPKQIKEKMMAALNTVVKKYGYDYAEDSTRVITIKKKDTKKSKILHSVDFAIVNNYVDEDEYDCQEYIRFNKKSRLYQWCEQPEGYYMLPEKIEWIKEEGLWDVLRDSYIKNKNSNEQQLHSRTIFAITVHQICQKNGFFDDDDF